MDNSYNNVSPRSPFFQSQGNFRLVFNYSGTMKICVRQGKFEQMDVNLSARSGDIKGLYFRFSTYESMMRVLIRIASTRRF